MTLSLSLIKQTMDAHLGEHVLVTAQAGRRKLIKRHGVLSETFNSVFVVELDKENSKFEQPPTIFEPQESLSRFLY